MKKADIKFAKNITNEKISTLQAGAFDGKIIVVNDAQHLLVVMKKLACEKVLGFDTESKPAFKKGEYNPVALVQISTEKVAYLIRINHTGITDELKDFFENKGIKKIGIALRDDLKDLKKIRPFKPEGFIEFNESVNKLGIESNGLRKLTAIILGFRVSKGAQTSNWENKTLTTAQKSYAATDAWVCIMMYNKVMKMGRI